MKEYCLTSIADTKAIAVKIAATVSAPVVIGLIGDLGAGKTTLVKCLVAALGGSNEVTSPTFVLQHIYNTTKGQVSHWDLYRLKSPPEELFEDLSGQGITIVEWVDKFGEIMESCDLIIKLKIGDLNNDSVVSRILTINGPRSAQF
jgi:tRNA threonylcarbamoyladenosine biosynthesis protein TsaE